MLKTHTFMFLFKKKGRGKKNPKQAQIANSLSPDSPVKKTKTPPKPPPM